MSRDARQHAYWMWGFFVLAAIAGLYQAWTARHDCNPDGVSYIDMGTAAAEGDWRALVNGHWSPLYPALLGAALGAVDPDPLDTYAVVQAVNYLCFVFTLFAFEFMLESVIRRGTHRPPDPGGTGDTQRLSPVHLAIIGNLLFLYCSLGEVRVETVSPDMLLAGVQLAAVGLLLRLGRGRNDLTWCLALGATLGLGYWVKAPVVPLVPLFLLGAWIAIGSWRRAIWRVALAALVFAAIAGPWMAVLSTEVGRPTFGESGRLNYAWHINETRPIYRHWTGGDGRFGTPAHPPRQIHESPDAFEFAEPIGGTYPLWLDPTYWHEGYRPKIDPGKHVRCLAHNLGGYWNMFSRVAGGSALASLLVLLVFSLGTRAGATLRALWGYWPLWLPVLAGLGMFALVVIRMRYSAAGVVMLFCACFAAVRVPAAPGASRLFRAIGAVIALFVIMAGFEHVIEDDPAERTYHRRVAEALLNDHGWEHGRRIAFIGASEKQFWPRLIRARIIADVPPHEVDEFWTADQETQREVIEALFSAGAESVVVEDPPPGADASQWTRIGDSDHYVFWKERE